MRIEQPDLEVSVEPIALERCSDSDVLPEQIKALQEDNVAVSRARAQIAGARVRFTHLVPSETVDETPVGIVNGFCGTESAYKQLAVELAIQGREVFYIRPPRTQTPFMALRRDHIRDVLKLQSQATWGVMKAIRSYTGHELFDLYGHSMGVPITTKTALHKPEHVRSVVLAGGAGQNGRNTFLGMVKKTVGVARKDVRQGRKELTQYVHPLVILGDTAHHALRRPDRTVREGFTVARIDDRPSLERLHNSVVKVGALLFEKDGYFNPSDVLAASGIYFDEVEVTPEATHVYPQDHPREHASDVNAMLRRLAVHQAPLNRSA